MKPMPYTAMQGVLGAAVPWGDRNYWECSFLRALPDAAADLLVGQVGRVTSRLAAAVLAD